MKINRTVLMSDALHFSVEQAINPYYGEGFLDKQKAIEEHHQIKTLLKEAGVNVLETPSPETSQDGVYTANWALVRGDTVVLARLPEVRKAEEACAEKALQALGKSVIKVPEGLKFSGQGDALACGNYLFCGQGYRSDEAAQAYAAEVLGYERIQLQTIPETDAEGTPVINDVSGWADSFFYDIDLALSIIRHPEEGKKGLIAYCPAAFTEESKIKIQALSDIERIEVSLEEAMQGFACNLVSTGETVVMTARAPRLANALREYGLNVVSPEITELAKGGGYIRCTTLTLD